MGRRGAALALLFVRALLRLLCAARLDAVRSIGRSLRLLRVRPQKESSLMPRRSQCCGRDLNVQSLRTPRELRVKAMSTVLPVRESPPALPSLLC